MTTTRSPASPHVGTPSSIARRTGYVILGALLIAVTAVLNGPTTTPTATAAAAAPVSPNTWCINKASMAILGDSASTGYGVIDPNNHWVAKFRRAKSNTRINNYAHDGAMVSDYLPGGRWPETTGAVNSIAVDQPSLVFIELGGNESYTDVDPAVYQANLEELTRAIWLVSPLSTLVYETIWPFDPRAVANPVHTWDQYANAMRTVAVNHAAGWIDLRQFFPAHYADDANTHLLNTDQIHPTDAGNAVEYAAILTILNGC